MIALSRTDSEPDSSAKPVQYAYLGPEGTFTEAALLAFDPGAAGHAMPCVSIQATLDAVRSGAAEQGIVPIENSVEGAVTATLDELATGQDLVISAEVPLPVAFALLARPGTQLGDVTTVGGHPQAQAQCRRWLGAAPAARGLAARVIQRRGRPPGRGRGSSTRRWPARSRRTCTVSRCWSPIPTITRTRSPVSSW